MGGGVSEYDANGIDLFHLYLAISLFLFQETSAFLWWWVRGEGRLEYYYKGAKPQKTLEYNTYAIDPFLHESICWG